MATMDVFLVMGYEIDSEAVTARSLHVISISTVKEGGKQVSESLSHVARAVLKHLLN